MDVWTLGRDVRRPRRLDHRHPACGAWSGAGAVRPGGGPIAVQPEHRPSSIRRASPISKRRPRPGRPTPPSARTSANLYFDARRFDLAIPWYEAALKLEPKNVNVSTDLAVAYFSVNELDRALKQVDYSLAIDRKHVKTLLNQGIVRALGKQDLEGAAASWQQVVAIAPDSAEARIARQGLDGIKSQHTARAGREGARWHGAAPMRILPWIFRILLILMVLRLVLRWLFPPRRPLQDGAKARPPGTARRRARARPELRHLYPQGEGAGRRIRGQCDLLLFGGVP